MNYDLVLKLKESGFPFIYATEEDNFNQVVKLDGKKYLIPTLSELIEACGERFESLALLDSGWQAIGLDETHNKVRTELYQSPEIAVANLWLELNKK